MTKQITTTQGHAVDFDAAVNLMDDEIREAVHAEAIEDEQAFFDRYAALHAAKYGTDFVVN